MLRAEGKRIIMTEGDFGLALPLTISGVTIGQDDEIKLSIKKTANEEDIVLSKKYVNIESNKIDFVLTEEDSKLLKPFIYVYTLDWYREDKFLCSIVRNGVFEVEDKY